MALLFYLIIICNTFLNDDSFVLFKDYKNFISINEKKLRESGNYYNRSKSLFAINLKKGNYVFSKEPDEIYQGQAICVNNKLKNKLIKSDYSEVISHITLTNDIYSRILVSLSFVTICSKEKNFPYFFVSHNSKKIYSETTPIANYIDIIDSNQNLNKFDFGFINKNNICCNCPSLNTGFEMGYHFCVMPIDINKKSLVYSGMENTTLIKQNKHLININNHTDKSLVDDWVEPVTSLSV